MVASSIVQQPARLPFPGRLQFVKDSRLASLPIVPTDILQLESGLMKFEPVAREVKQWSHQSAHIFLPSPYHERQRRIAPFSFVNRIVLVARAVAHAVPIDQLEVLAKQMTPGIVDRRLGSFDVHPFAQKFFPSV